MQALLRKIRQILKDRRTRKFFTRAVSSVAAIVVFVTTYALILPAITLEKTAVCGIEAHQHDDSCYEERLVCGQEENDGHHHDDSCYSTTTELTCGIQEHQHSEENGCYDADGNLVCQLQEHVHDDSCYEEVRTLTCGLEESEGHHHTDACYEKVLVCGKEVHTHSDKCYEKDSSTDSAEDGDSAGMPSDSVDAGDNENTGENGDTGNTVPEASDSDASAGEEQSDSYVPELKPLDMEAVLNSHTDFYYFHAEEGEEVPANSAEITEWKKVDEETRLESTDLVKMYLAYKIPAGSLNATNPTARYRLPDNVHLSDEQIKAINLYENGIAAGYREISAASENDEKDQAEENYKKYLGVEAVEGDRRPDEQLMDGAQEFISAVVRAENVYDEEGLYGEKGACLGQDLIFTFAPYSVEKNQNTYDADRTLISAGEKITGWFACDFKLNQIDWEQEDENKEEDIIQEDTNGEENTDEESIGEDGIGQDDNDNNIENTDTKDNAEKTAKVIFVQEDQEKEIEEISRMLRMDGEIDDGTSSEKMTDAPEETGEDQDDMDDQGDQVFKAGTLTYEGDDYSITLDYGEDAKIPENASLSVREITAETDKEAYEACLEQAGQQVAADDKTSVDQKASRFFDIEILVTETESDGTEKTVKIEPAAPVSVNIRINEKPASQESESDQSEPTVLHFAEEGVEQIDSTVTDSRNNDKEEQKTEIQFEAESFSVYGVVYTVDFHYEVDGKMYEFSIPGGGFASFYKIVEVLGISELGTQSGSGDKNAENGDENAAENSEIEAGNGENTDENAVHNVAEETGVEENEANTGAYEESINLNNVEVSEATKKFVADVASVEFSSPELVWVGKVDETSTVGGLKEANGLEVQYSAELTEEQIAEINSSTVEAGDWALISMLPFTSEESLTVTMKNGDQFVVRVTDGQDVTEVAEVDADGFYVLYVDQYRNNAHHYYALRNDGASVPVPNNDLDSLGNEFTWRFGYDGTACWWYNGSNYIEPEWSTVVGDNPGGRYLWVEKRGSGFGIHGNYWSDNYLSWDSSNGFKIVNSGFDVAIKIYEKDKPQLNFSVAVNNPSYGSVSCSNTVTDLEWKNTVPIVATPAEGCYFVGWRRGEEVLTGYDSTIPVGGIEFTQDNQILTAVFAKNYTSPATQEINEWVDSLLGNPLVSEKTAHVLDYDNRIYEVDLTASSSRYTIDQDIRIEFITDISRSMYFPETLLNEQDFTVNGQINLGQWLLDNGDPEEVYYVIGDINNTATMYAVYFSGNDYFTRWSIIDASYYLPYDNASTSGRIKNVCQISNGNTTVSITDRFADNRIFTGKIYNSTPKPPKDTADWDRLSYLTAAVKAVSRAIYRLDPGAEIGLVTFASAASGGTLYGADDEASLISEINSIQPVGGTNQTSAFNLINNSNPPVFTTNSGKRQVALLITDGAPQGTTWDAIERAAGTTEGNGVEIWTLGLALDRVGNNKSRLMNLASEGGYSGNAEDADQLVTETKNILEKMLVKATVIGEVYDTVDPAFYPVDVSGNPIKEGYYYADTTGGSVTRHSTAPVDVKKAYYHWVNNNGTWSVAYFNQEIKWPEDGGWKESFYIKAKEDFMGGNTISTNSGVDNRVEANRVKHSSSPDGYYWLNQDHSSFRVDYETPHVNVDELSMTENSTEWTVYLGTEVDPEKELRELWDKIRVNLVVKKNGMNADTYTVTNGSQMYYSDDLLNDAGSPDGTTNASLPLSHFVNPDLIETLLRQIKNGETTANSDLIYRYFPYGHSIIGTFELSLEKTVNQVAAEDGAPKQHETKEKGQEKEVYTLKVTYTPVGDNASTDYAHTTSGKSAGKVADGYDGTTGNRIDSENVHKIHVFAKDLEIQKKDMTNTNKLIDTAKFKLYRTAKKVIDPETGQETSQYESGTVDLKVGNETKKVVQIGDEMTTSGGKITVEDLSYAPDGVYYLEETKAPDGYIISESPMTIRLTLKDEYRDYKDPKPVITDISNTPYNWTQTVQKLAYANSKDGTGDDEKFVVEVLNNPGVELPSTGGPGTNLIYLIGLLLTSFAGTGILMKKLRRKAA